MHCLTTTHFNFRHLLSSSCCCGVLSSCWKLPEAPASSCPSKQTQSAPDTLRHRLSSGSQACASSRAVILSLANADRRGLMNFGSETMDRVTTTHRKAGKQDILPCSSFVLCVVSRERNRKARSVAEIDGSWPSATATLSVRAVRSLNPLRFRHHDPDLKPAERAPRTRQHMTGFARNWGPRERKWVYSSYDDLIFEQASPGPARALRFEF